MNDADARRLYQTTLEDFMSSVSVSDPFGLLRADTPELPRYALTLRAAAEYATGPADDPVLCDVGGYYGLIAASAATLGYRAHVVDHYAWSGAAHSDVREWWASRELTVHDIDLQAPFVRLPFPTGTVDLVVFAAVIEHFAHTPRLVLDEIRRVLRPGGRLVIDTPNAGALGLRVGFLLHGEGLWEPIKDIYESDIPFLGHSRCYSRHELRQVLHWSGFRPVETVMFDLQPPEPPVRRSVKGRLLYDGIYPRLAARVPDLRGYIWMSAEPA